MSAARSSTWRWSSQSCRRESWPFGSPTSRSIFVSEASVSNRLLKAHGLITSPAYVVIKAANEFKDKTTAINQLWQTDFTYLKIAGWGWYYLSTVLDDFSRYIVAWRLGPTMCASDVTATLDQALAASGLDHITVTPRPRLLSDNGSSYVADDLAKWLKGNGMQHVRGAPYHPQTQGKIERWHQTLKNRILLDNYYLPGDLERQIGAFVEHYNHVRYHESIKNLTPAAVYFGRAETILAERKRIKLATIANRRLQHRLQAVGTPTLMSQTLPSRNACSVSNYLTTDTRFSQSLCLHHSSGGTPLRRAVGTTGRQSDDRSTIDTGPPVVGES